MKKILCLLSTICLTMNAQLRTEQELSFQQKSVDFGRDPNDTVYMLNM